MPAVLSAAELVGASADDIVLAIAAGYEVAVRIAAARNPAGLDTMATGRWVHYGVTAALGRLRGVSPATLAEALAIAGVHGPNQSASGYSRTMGSP